MLALHARPRGENPFDDARVAGAEGRAGGPPGRPRGRRAAAHARPRAAPRVLRAPGPDARGRRAPPRRPRRGPRGREARESKDPARARRAGRPRAGRRAGSAAVPRADSPSTVTGLLLGGGALVLAVALPTGLALPADGLGAGREPSARRPPPRSGHASGRPSAATTAPASRPRTTRRSRGTARAGTTSSGRRAIPLPGASSPIVWGDRVFLTGADRRARGGVLPRRAHRRHALEEGAGRGGIARARPSSPWRTPATRHRRRRPTAGTCSPCSRAAAWRPSTWTGSRCGSGPSAPSRTPTVTPRRWPSSRTTCSLQLDQGLRDDELARLVALDATTGKTVWETPRRGGLVVGLADRLPSRRRVRRWSSRPRRSSRPTTPRPEPRSGGPTSSTERSRPRRSAATAWSTCVHEDVGLFAIRTDGTGDVTKTHVSWNAADGAPDVTSPLCDGDARLPAHDERDAHVRPRRLGRGGLGARARGGLLRVARPGRRASST